MTRTLPTFEVDKAGLGKLLARRGAEFIGYELLQNAWDEPRTTTVTLDADFLGGGRAIIRCADDNPEGFADMRDAYTLFAESRKKANPEQRGRFNLGEKLVIALASRATIKTTKGTITFEGSERRQSRSARPFGTEFEAEFRMKASDVARIVMGARSCLPPAGIATYVNGELVPVHAPAHEFSAALDTEVADAEGYLRPSTRRCDVRLFEPREGEQAHIFEMGIPVVETGDRWHIDISQKVPLNTDRDNVRPAFLRRLRALVTNEMAAAMSPEDASARWVSDALGSRDIEPEAVSAILDRRFGTKRVINDPSDPEGTKIAMSRGYMVIPSRAFAADQWERIREAGAALPAGRVTPSPKAYSDSPDARPLRLVERERWTPEQEATAALAEAVARALALPCAVRIASDATWPFSATYGASGELTLNVGRLGHRWFARPGSGDQLALLLHEFAHGRVTDHLSSGFADEIARLGAGLALAVASGALPEISGADRLPA